MGAGQVETGRMSLVTGGIRGQLGQGRGHRGQLPHSCPPPTASTARDHIVMLVQVVYVSFVFVCVRFPRLCILHITRSCRCSVRFEKFRGPGGTTMGISRVVRSTQYVLVLLSVFATS